MAYLFVVLKRRQVLLSLVIFAFALLFILLAFDEYRYAGKEEPVRLRFRERRHVEGLEEVVERQLLTSATTTSRARTTESTTITISTTQPTTTTSTFSSTTTTTIPITTTTTTMTTTTTTARAPTAAAPVLGIALLDSGLLDLPPATIETTTTTESLSTTKSEELPPLPSQRPPCGADDVFAPSFGRDLDAWRRADDVLDAVEVEEEAKRLFDAVDSVDRRHSCHHLAKIQREIVGSGDATALAAADAVAAELEARAQRLARLRYEPSTCSLNAVDYKLIERRLQRIGTKFFFIGDSISHQRHDAFLATSPLLRSNNHIVYIKALFDPVSAIVKLIDNGRAVDKDVIIFDAYLWIYANVHDDDSPFWRLSLTDFYSQLSLQLKHELSQRSFKHMPHILISEPLAEAWPAWSGRFANVVSRQRHRRCALLESSRLRSPPSRAHLAAFRASRIVRRKFTNLHRRVSIMPGFMASASMHDAHVGIHRATLNSSLDWYVPPAAHRLCSMLTYQRRRVSSTHFCAPGFHELFSVKVLMLMADALVRFDYRVQDWERREAEAALAVEWRAVESLPAAEWQVQQPFSTADDVGSVASVRRFLLPIATPLGIAAADERRHEAVYRTPLSLLLHRTTHLHLRANVVNREGIESIEILHRLNNLLVRIDCACEGQREASPTTASVERRRIELENGTAIVANDFNHLSNTDNIDDINDDDRNLNNNSSASPSSSTILLSASDTAHLVTVGDVFDVGVQRCCDDVRVRLRAAANDGIDGLIVKDKHDEHRDDIYQNFVIDHGDDVWRSGGRWRLVHPSHTPPATFDGRPARLLDSARLLDVFEQNI